MVALAAVCPICVKFVQDDPGHRSIRKPSSFVEFSLHARLIAPNPVVTVRFVGAAGGTGAAGAGWVVACAGLEKSDVPPLLYARTM